MIKLKLIKPTIEYKDQVLETVQEFFDNNSELYWVSGLKRYFDDYEWWLDLLNDREKSETVDEGHVLSKQFLLIRESDNRLIWFINIRLELNDVLLEHWWHIWYAIRPSERKKSFATAQLFSVLPTYEDIWVEKVLLTCNKVNIWSAKTIQKCGWILENEIIDPTDGELIQRYWIDVAEWIKKWKDFFENSWINVEVL